MDRETSTEEKSFIKEVLAPLVLLALLFVLYAYKDSVMNLLLVDKKNAPLAEVTALQNNVRKKDSKSIDFKSAEPYEPLFHGDSLATGSKSAALVTFKSGQILNVDQNSLIIFDEYSDVPEFVKGNIKLVLKGKMKLKIDDEIVEIDGGDSQSDVQIYKDEKIKSKKIVLLKGDAVVKSLIQEKPVALKINIPIEPKKIIKADDLLQETRTPSQENTKPMPTLVKQAPTVSTPVAGNYKLYDYYTRLLSSSTELGRNKSFTLKPNHSFENFLELATTIKFQSISGAEDIGHNFYVMKIEDVSEAEGYVVEISEDEYFSDNKTQFLWRKSYFKHDFSKSGTYYLRFRKVLPGQLLTSYSPIEKIFIPEKKASIIAAKPAPFIESVPQKEKSKILKKVVDLPVEPIRTQKKRDVAAAADTKVELPTQSLTQSPPLKLPTWLNQLGFYIDNRFSHFSADNDQTATNARLLTSRDLNLRLTLQSELSTNWKATYSLKIRNMQFSPTEGGPVNIESRSIWTSGLQGQFSYEENRNLVPYFNFNFSQEIFLRELGSTTINPNIASIPYVGSGFQYWLVNRNKLDFGIDNEIAYYLSSQANLYSVGSGYGFRSGFMLRYSGEDRNLTAGIGYTYKKQGSSDTKQSESGALIFLNSSFSSQKR